MDNKQWCKSPLFQEVNTTYELQQILNNLIRDELVELWRSIHNRYPPKSLNISFIKRSIIYEWQCISYGGISRQVMANIRHSIATNNNKLQKLTIGTQLLREWRGRTYRVDITEQGYNHNDKTYKSLSAIAKHITGMEYSGYRFFGLKKVNLKRYASNNHNKHKVAS